MGTVEIQVATGSLTIQREGRQVVAKFDEFEAAARKGYLAPAVVLGVINRRIGGVRACYSRALKSNPNIFGRLEIQFTIGSTGQVTDVEVLNDTIGSDSLRECIISAVRTWNFPAPKDGDVTIKYPFIFEQTY
jgi:TonB family protein